MRYLSATRSPMPGRNWDDIRTHHEHNTELEWAGMNLLSAASAAVAARYPGESSRRQPVHTVYGGGHLFKHDTAQKLGKLALKALAEHAPDAATFARGVGLREDLAAAIYERVVQKLDREPVEDFRIDFEDGYGSRPDEEEDHHTELAAREVASRQRAKDAAAVHRHPHQVLLAPARSVRTLDMFLTTLGKGMPEGFVVTFPKIQHIDQVRAFVRRALRDRAAHRPPEARPDRDHGGAAADRSSRPMAASPSRSSTTRARVDSSARTSEPTTTRRASASPPRTSTWFTPRATSPSTDAGRLRRHGRDALRRRDQRDARRRPRRASSPRGSSTLRT